MHEERWMLQSSQLLSIPIHGASAWLGCSSNESIKVGRVFQRVIKALLDKLISEESVVKGHNVNEVFVYFKGPICEAAVDSTKPKGVSSRWKEVGVRRYIDYHSTYSDVPFSTGLAIFTTLV